MAVYRELYVVNALYLLAFVKCCFHVVTALYHFKL